MSMLERPKHLDIPDEVSINGKLTHIYEVHPNGKRTIESLIFLCGHYHYVEVVTTSTGEGLARTEFHCRAAFMELDFELNVDN